MKQIFGILMVAGLTTGCVVPAPKPTIGIGTGIGIGTQIPQPADSAYGFKPQNYQAAIKSYFSAKLKRASQAHYQFGLPKRAYKKKGLAYGGELAWKGWMVETLIAIPSRTGRLTQPKPYIVLFSGNQIVEAILGTSHRLLTQVDK